MGTTGTSSLFNQLCAMGLHASHSSKTCNRKSSACGVKERGLGDNWLSASLSFNNGNHTAAVEAARGLVAEAIAKLQSCEFEAVVDTPVPWMFDELRLAFPEALVILTTRDPHKWASSRVRDHRSSYICAEGADPDWLPPHPLGIDDGVRPLLPHRFALRACIERAAFRARTTGQQSRLRMLKTDSEPVIPIQKSIPSLPRALAIFQNHVRMTTSHLQRPYQTWLISNQSDLITSASIYQESSIASRLNQSETIGFLETDITTADACSTLRTLEEALPSVTTAPEWNGDRFGIPVCRTESEKNFLIRKMSFIPILSNKWNCSSSCP